MHRLPILTLDLLAHLVCDHSTLVLFSHPIPALLVHPLSAIILRTHHQSLPLTRTPIHRLHDINQLLLIANRKIDFIIIPRAKVNLHVPVAPEKHDRARVVDFVHGVEVGDLLYIVSCC